MQTVASAIRYVGLTGQLQLHLNNLSCNGLEHRLIDCRHSITWSSTCSLYGAGVSCRQGKYCGICSKMIKNLFWRLLQMTHYLIWPPTSNICLSCVPGSVDWVLQSSFVTTNLFTGKGGTTDLVRLPFTLSLYSSRLSADFTDAMDTKINTRLPSQWLGASLLHCNWTFCPVVE